MLAIALDQPWSVAFSLVALIGYSVLLLILSARISHVVSGARRVDRSAQKATADTEAGATGGSDEAIRAATRMTSAIDALRAAAIRLETLDDELHDLGDLPHVTVVVPCYNEERFVAEALRSVLQQSFTEWECLVVDDASTDGSLRQIFSVTETDERFRVLRHRVNSGLSAARNTGLRAARGRYVTFLDADDLLMSESLVDRVIVLSNEEEDPHVLGSYCGVRVSHEEVTLDDLPWKMKFESGGVIDLVSADSECPFNAHAPLMLVDRLRPLGGFNETMRRGAEDWDLWYRALRNGYVFVPSRYTTAVYRQKRQSMVRTIPEGHISEADRLINAAHGPADPSILTAPSPTPLTEPIGHYQALLHRADRAIRFAAMALVAGDELAAERILNVLAQVPLPLVERHSDLANLAHRGIRRALAIGPRELHSVDQLTQPILRRLRLLIDNASSAYEPERTQIVPPPSVGALLVPQQSGQLTPMIEMAEAQGFDRAEIAVLNIEREGGSQGAAREVPRSMDRWSLNQWALQGGVCKALFVGTIRTGVVDLIARVAVDKGGQVVEVRQANADVLQLPDANRRKLSSDVGSPVTLGESLFGSHLQHTDGDPTSWWSVEEFPDTIVDTIELAGFRDRYRGEQVVIIGNGPSLNELDLTRLKSEYTIAVNGIFYAAEKMGFDPSFYVVEDTAVMRDNLAEIRAYQAGHKFFPSTYRNMIGPQPNVSYFMMNRGFYEPQSPDFCVPRFSVDPSHNVFSGQSVTMINLQLAYHLGFERAILIGMDFSYTVPADAIVEGDVITSTNSDPNHFHPDYFGPGKVWKDPKLDRVLANYALAKQIYEADGRRIVNASAGGKLELFDRVPYSDLFN